jgi:hypothetical protein
MCLAILLGLGQNERNDEPVQTQRFTENENKNHADKKLGLLAVGPDPCVTNNTNRKAGRQRRQTARQTSSQVGKTVKARVRGLDCTHEHRENCHVRSH